MCGNMYNDCVQYYFYCQINILGYLLHNDNLRNFTFHMHDDVDLGKFMASYVFTI